MTSTLLIDGVVGKAVIYTGAPADETPLTDWRGQIDRIQFHSDIPYDRVAAVAVASITLPAMNENAVRTVTTALTAHGQAGRPFVFGSAKVTSYSSGSTGSGLAVNTAVGFPSTLVVDQQGTFCRRLYLMADATTIYLHEKSQSSYFAATVQRYPSMTLEITAYITDTIV